MSYNPGARYLTDYFSNLFVIEIALFYETRNVYKNPRLKTFCESVVATFCLAFATNCKLITKVFFLEYPVNINCSLTL